MPQHHPVVTDRKVAALKQAMGPVIASALARFICAYRWIAGAYSRSTAARSSAFPSAS